MNGTHAVHAGVNADPVTGAILTPIYQTTAYKQNSVERYLESGYSYSRCDNPTVHTLESKIGILEGSNLPAIVYGTGMAAFNCVIVSLLRTGDHVVMTRCSYGGSNRAMRVQWGREFGLDVSFVDFRDLKAVEKAIIPGKTKAIFSETPCNPVLELQDLRALSDLCKKYSEKNPPRVTEILKPGDGPSRQCLTGKIIHVADTTLAPPPVLRGLDFGVDIVLVSLTKYYCGHNAHLGGAAITLHKELYDLLNFKRNVMGTIMTPFTAFGILQTTKTMCLRVKKQSENADKIANFLNSHEKIEWVRYPGLKSHPDNLIAMKQHLNGIHGGMIAFEVKGGANSGRAVMNHCSHPWTLAENLGSVESIMTCPSVFTHANMTKEDRLAAGITDGMIRLSVGIEDAEDLIATLDIALSYAII